jgi:hypothetical protein
MPLAGENGPNLTLNNVTINDSGDYDLVATNEIGTAISQVAALSVIEPPSINVQPQSQAAILGANVTFSVVASGTPTPDLGYQWRKGGIPISGAVGPTLTLSNVQVSDVGDYDVLVSNWAGSITSQVATLTVSAPIVWTGLVSSDWNNPTNWTPQQVPTSSDVAVINSGTVTVATNAQFLALNLNDGSLTGPVVVGTGSILNWSKGFLLPSGSLTVQSNGVLNLQTGGAKYCDGSLTNHGTVNWTGGTFHIRNNNAAQKGQVVNLGLWEMQGDLTLASWHNTGLELFHNGGIFRKASGSGRGIFNAVLDNEFGALEVLSGTLRFDQGVQLDGLFIVSSGAVMQWHRGTATYTPLTRLTGQGQYQLTGGTLQGLLDYQPNLRLLDGSVALSPNYQTNGTIEWLDLDGSMLLGDNLVSGVLNWNSGVARALRIRLAVEL